MNKNNLENKENKEKTLENNKCIGPCYPENFLYYNPLTLQPIIQPMPTCGIMPSDKKSEFDIFKKCDLVTGNYNNYDLFNEFDKIASSPINFLSQIYEIKNYTDVINFIKNDINNLPLYTQRRILNAVYVAYKNAIEFPDPLFITCFINVFKKLYNINLNNNNITKKIIKYKNKTDVMDIFKFVNSKFL